jgi:O-antigen ligase
MTYGGAGAYAGYWPGAVSVVILMMTVVAVRLHEFLPMLAIVKPVLTITFVSFVFLLSHTSGQVTRRVLGYAQTKRVIAYFLLAAVTIPLALWPLEAYNNTSALLPAVLFFVAILLCPPRREVLDKLELAFVTLVLIYAGYTMTVGRMWRGRLETVGGFYDMNDMASLLAMAFPIAASMLSRAAPGRARIIAIVACVTLVLTIIGSGSRGGTLALLAGAIVFALGQKGGRGLVIIAVMLVGGFFAWTTASDTFRQRIISISDLENDYNTVDEYGRKAVWKRGRAYWRDNMVKGVGAGNFPTAEGNYFAVEGRPGKWSAAHNAYLQAFVELGTIGGVIFSWILLSAAWRALPMWLGRRGGSGRGPPAFYRPEFLASLLAYATGAIFLSHAYFHPLFALLGMIALADHVRRAEQQGGTTAAAAVPARIRSQGERGGAALFGLAQPTPLRRSGLRPQ